VQRYIGSYAMDGLAMALHCVYSTRSFQAAVLKAVNLQGDADSVGSVTGQLAGAIYGVAGIPRDWLETVQQWDRHGDIALKAHKLMHRDWVPMTPLRRKEEEEQGSVGSSQAEAVVATRSPAASSLSVKCLEYLFHFLFLFFLTFTVRRAVAAELSGRQYLNFQAQIYGL
jgi:hypothetical protein